MSPPGRRSGPTEAEPPAGRNTTTTLDQRPAVAPIVTHRRDGSGLVERAVWNGRRFPDPQPAGLSDAEREHEILDKLGQGWELAEVLTVVEAPGWWPAGDLDDPGR